MKYTGSILRNGRVIARGWTINIRTQGKRWSGEIVLETESSIFPGGYGLHLNDGRKGQITVSVVDGETAYFEGDGELK
ncbi:MAG: hypothetical protein FJ271_01630 [Planctomycetes bacterium]|nr:hypothetical protein [Planctomycetota bacterium]